MKSEMEQDEGKWSELPTLLIWMIKDRLSYIVDDVNLGFVCKNWKDASESYPSRTRHQRCISPWLNLGYLRSKTAEFVNVTTKEKLVLDIPEFHDGIHKFLFSRRGWLLFRRCRYSVVLLNLHTNGKIVMPYPAESLQSTMASFSAYDDDTPRHVVFAQFDSNVRCMTFYVACVGDKKWSIQSYVNERRLEVPVSLVARGHKAYCLECRGGLLIFDMVSLRVQELVVNTDHITRNDIYWRWRIMESEEGWVVKIGYCAYFGFGKPCFFKLSDSQTSWEELGENVKDRCWFLFHKNNHFTVKENPGVRKAYRLARDIRNAEIVTVHDLVEGSVNHYNPQISAMDYVNGLIWVLFIRSRSLVCAMFFRSCVESSRLLCLGVC